MYMYHINQVLSFTVSSKCFLCLNYKYKYASLMFFFEASFLLKVTKYSSNILFLLCVVESVFVQFSRWLFCAFNRVIFMFTLVSLCLQTFPPRMGFQTKSKIGNEKCFDQAFSTRFEEEPKFANHNGARCDSSSVASLLVGSLFSQAWRRKDSPLISAGSRLNSKNSPVPLKYATLLGQINVRCRESTEG